MKHELSRIKKLYAQNKLSEATDEKDAEGYWDLAAELTELLSSDKMTCFEFDQLQTGFYQVLQKVLVKKEYYQ